MATITTLENFEDATIAFPVSGSWARSTDNAYEGSYCYQKKSSNGYCDFTLTIPSGSTNCKVSFYAWVDSNTSSPLIVTVDGAEIWRKSGGGLFKPWDLVEANLTPGTHTIRFNFAWGATGFSNQACIDNLKLVYDEATAQPVPRIDSVTITPNPVDAGANFLIAVGVSEVMV